MVKQPEHRVKGPRLKPRKPMPYTPRIDDGEVLHDDANGDTDPDIGRGVVPPPPPSATHAKSRRAWTGRADALAAWTMRRLVNRRDTWGQYLPLDQRSGGKARTCKGTLTEEILSRHYRGAEVSDLVGLHTTSADNTSRWLGIDIDQHGDPDDEKKRNNRIVAKKLYNRVKGLGFDPLLISSNGRGGYHLILLFGKPVPTPKVHSFGKWLVRDWQDLGLAEEPESFPKQPRLEEKKGYGNFLRLPGRHHTLDYYSKVWTGERWAAGEEAIEAILATKGVSPRLIPSEVSEYEDITRPSAVSKAPIITAAKVGQIRQRALALLHTLRAVQGKGGDKVTWTAASYLVKDFALSVEQALPLMREWNATHCQPPWSEAELLRKLRLGAEEPGERGRLLEEASGVGPVESPPASGTGIPFHIEVPDFILADWEMVRPKAPPRTKGRPSATLDLFRAVYRTAVIGQRSSRVCLPDAALSQLLVKGSRRWPQKGWRRALTRTLSRVFDRLKIPVVFHSACTPTCPLHGRKDVPHRHFHFTHPEPGSFLGVLQAFYVSWEERDGVSVYAYDFKDEKSHHPNPAVAAELQKEIAKGIKKSWSIYLPAWLFGPAVLKPGPCRILKRLTRELTRSKGKNNRLDKAQVIQGNTHAFLDEGRRYVGFNGNGTPRYHGHGYRIKTWMGRSGYNSDTTGLLHWKEARKFLTDLRGLCGPFGLVAGGYRGDKREWHPLDRLVEMTRSLEGRRWLAKCNLKVFGPEDYLVRWREHFARAMGFSFIPGDREGKVADTVQDDDAPTRITSGLGLDAWMRMEGMTNRTLAVELGVPASQVGSQRSGARPWSAGFLEKLRDYLNPAAQDNDEGVP